MKLKLLLILTALGLILAVTDSSEGFSFHNGPVFGKTLNYEIGTLYLGGEVGNFYFRDDTTSYHTAEHGLLTYDALDPTHKLFSDFDAVIRNDSLKDDEDTFGLLRFTTIADGNVSGTDSRFGDGSDASAVGNNISGGSIYWAEGLSDNEYMRGILWGGQDQIVELLSEGDDGGTPLDPSDDILPRYRVYNDGSQFEVWLIDGDAAYDPAVAGNPSPTDRPVDPSAFPGWFDETTDELLLAGELSYFRFEGELAIPPIFDPEQLDGQTEVLLDFYEGAAGGSQADRLSDWWTAPDGTPSEIWQSWNIYDPFTIENGWTGSEDSARGFIPVPEPTTMLGVFLGLGSLVGYVRNKKR